MITFHFSLLEEAASITNNQQKISGGEIYIETENGYFPCRGWSDLLLIVVLQWISNFIRLVNSNQNEHDVPNYFMDGPFFFNIKRVERDHITVRFMKGGISHETEKIAPLEITLKDYCNALLSLAVGIIKDPNFQYLGKEKERIALSKGVTLLKELLPSL